MLRLRKLSKNERAGLWLLVSIVIIVAICVLGLYLHHTTIAILQPRGPVARQERNLIVFAALLSLVVVLPVFSLTIYIVWKYREGNSRPRLYSPDWDHNPVLETFWWLIPTLLIIILSVVTWRSSHSLDPYKPLSSSNKPMTIQVLALNWKWLFIYPSQHIATVNYVEFPANTPVTFQVSADGPMNSFWIPQLSGQIYAMSGMSTEIHMSADSTGIYQGRSANISGEGFAGMHFTARSDSLVTFDGWVQFVKQSPRHLSMTDYTALAQPSQNNPITYYSSVDNYLYDKVVLKTTPDANTFGVNLP